jgi:hypothetical protein
MTEFFSGFAPRLIATSGAEVNLMTGGTGARPHPNAAAQEREGPA